ncbi:capsular biosynthesis protein [Paenibacillus sp. KS1]|uniref:CapA family protein n=1 Tax=Paenibacillus sp. KS1 TaxID=1849249 RepID=UPI00080645D5|nr:CapA family protein [Paenibacillus sp. KS1]OBY79692.1 capsular biosynthesis protein [Paenibacillus sp. KS1]
MSKGRYVRTGLLVIAIVLLILSTACAIAAPSQLVDQDASSSQSTTGSEQQTKPQPAHKAALAQHKDSSPSSTDADHLNSSTNIPASTATTPPNNTKAKPYTLSSKLLAVGDIMMHSPQFPAYFNKKTGTYNFKTYFTKVKPILETADWCWANLETPLLGGEKVYTGYPMFNAPPELADALKFAGFNIVTAANNHSLDRYEAGALRTLEVLKKKGLVTKGLSASLWESKQPTLVEKNGIQLGILAYTYGTNGIPLPKQKPYLVSLIDEKRMIQDIQNTKKAGADVVAIAIHFGTEYEHTPNQEQIRLARSLIQAGADIILGSHPHVIQPYERITVREPDGSKRDGLIIYSMGNFISNQTGNGTDIGVIFGVEINKHMPEGTIELKNVTTIPTWVHIEGARDKRKYRVLPLEQTIKSHSDNRLSTQQYQAMKKMLTSATSHLASRSAVPVILNVSPSP